jgi:Tfp pilus assembly protein PilF
MKATLSVLTVVVLAFLAYQSVDRIPGDSVGLLQMNGRSEILKPGFHLRVPFSRRPTIYPRRLPAVSGTAAVTMADGLTLNLAYESSAAMDPEQAGAFEKAIAQAEPGDLIRRASERAIQEAAAASAPEDLASGSLESRSAQRAVALLATSGVSDVTLKLGSLDPPSLLKLARALAPKRLAGMLHETAERALPSGGWEIHTVMGLVHESEHDPHGAEKEYLDALTMSPTALPPMAQLVALYTAVGEYKKLDRLLDAALQADATSLQHLNWLAVSQMKQDRLADAEKTVGRALAIEPKNALLLNNLGGIQLKQGRLPDAVESFRRAVKASPGDPQSLYNLGVALCSGGSFDEGLPNLLEAEKVGAESPALLRAISLAYKKLGKSSKAAEYERRAGALAAAHSG